MHGAVQLTQVSGMERKACWMKPWINAIRTRNLKTI